MRKTMLKLHLWLGLPAAAVLLIVSLTGALLVFEKDLDRAWHPEAWKTSAGAPQSLDTLAVAARAAVPGRDLQQVRLTAGEGQPVEFRFTKGRHVRIDAVSGETLGTRSNESSFFGIVEKIHTSLVAGEIGKWIVGLSTVALIALLGTGLFLWWPKQWRMLKNAVTLALSRKGRAFHFNLHNTLGFWSALPLLLIALTGTVMAFKPVGHALRSIGGGGEPAQRMPQAASPASLPAASLDALAATARTAFPSARELRLHAPKPKGEKAADMSGMDEYAGEKPAKGPAQTVWRVEAIDVSSPHEHARSLAYLDPRTAALLKLETFAERPLGERIRALVMPIHDGSIFGRPTQVLALIAVLILPILSVTGVALWWLRRRSAKAKIKCDALGLTRQAAAKNPRPAARPPANIPVPVAPRTAAASLETAPLR